MAEYTSEAEDCPACGEKQDLCDYHQGISDGWDLCAGAIARTVDVAEVMNG